MGVDDAPEHPPPFGSVTDAEFPSWRGYNDHRRCFHSRGRRRHALDPTPALLLSIATCAEPHAVWP
jgi:hypothetical protein